MKPENKEMLVRGVVAAGSRYDSGLTTIVKDAIEKGQAIAFTHWYRHDDDLNALEAEVDSLVKCYRAMKKTDVIGYHYEYKEYRK